MNLTVQGLGCPGECSCSSPLGEVADYDVIVVGGQKYSANQLVDAQLIAKNPVKLYRGSDFINPYATVPSGQVIGRVYSYIKADQASAQRAASPLLMFYDSSGKAFYVKDDRNIDTAFLREQGVKTVAEETKEELEQKKRESDPVGYYLKRYGVPALLIIGGLVIAGGVIRDTVKTKVLTRKAEPAA